MAETITADAADRSSSLIRRRNASEAEVAKWTTDPGFRYAEAVDLIKKGEVYKTVYEIYGEGAPASNYDNATCGSKYNDIANGAVYHRVFQDDDTTLAWAVVIVAIAGTATTSYTNHPAGGVLGYNGADDTVLKYAAEDSDGDAHLY